MRPAFRRRRQGRRRARRGIYILPSLLTVGNVLCGYSAMVSAARGEFTHAALLVLAAGLLDTLDGRVARLTRTTSDFGVQFDSLADVISFGVAPSVVVYWWGMTPLGRFGWAASFLFVICGAMRLARFNIHAGTADKRYFIGLPIPMAAMVLATLVFHRPEPVAERPVAVAVLLLVLVLAALMVSRLRYWSFKASDARGPRKSFLTVALIALLLAGVAVDPPIVLLSLALLYMLSGLMPRLTRPAGVTGSQRTAPSPPTAMPSDEEVRGQER